MSEPTPEQLARVGEWIRREAAAKLPDEILAWVTERQEQLIASVRVAGDDALRAAGPDGGWSALEAFTHVVEWNWQVGEDILHACLMGERPGNPVPQFEPNVEPLIARQQESLASVWAHVSAADPEGFLELKWEHPFFGMLNWREWFLFIGVHCTDHANQIRAASTHGA